MPKLCQFYLVQKKTATRGTIFMKLHNVSYILVFLIRHEFNLFLVAIIRIFFDFSCNLWCMTPRSYRRSWTLWTKLLWYMFRTVGWSHLKGRTKLLEQNPVRLESMSSLQKLACYRWRYNVTISGSGFSNWDKMSPSARFSKFQKIRKFPVEGGFSKRNETKTKENSYLEIVSQFLELVRGAF